MSPDGLSGGTSLLREVVAGHFLPRPPDRVGLAVSGGSDSTALLILMSDIAADLGGMALDVVTVDHGLRPEAADEAAAVARLAEGLGHAHTTLRWQGWDGRGNTQDAARRARYDLIGDWARDRGIPCVALGHTADDQAETVLMRLARAAGPDGLAGMRPRRHHRGVEFLRPMLGLRRADLRRMLRARGVDWAEDPGNSDPRYDRIRVRQALELLEPLGLTVPALTSVAAHSAAIRETLDFYTYTEARACVRIEGGDVVMPLRDLRRLRPEILRRILNAALQWLTGSDYPPRARATRLLAEALRAGTAMTLHGCHAMVTGDEMRLTREARAVAGAVAAPGAPWDGRWRLDARDGQDVPKRAEIRHLGAAGLAECPHWREIGAPRASLMAGPAVWLGDRLLAAPLAGRPEGWTATLIRDDEALFGFFLSH